MQLSFPSFLICYLLTNLVINAPVYASSERKCLESLVSINKQLKDRSDVVLRTELGDMSNFRDDYPKSRPISYSFILKGGSTEAIMKSSKFQKNIAEKIILHCSSISIVHFNASGSDWVNTFGLIDSRNVEAFRCLSPGEKVRWGEVICL